jgi:carboxyvinyl-carboxyphosphonate phosphorylmutase
MECRKRFRELVEAKEILVLPGAYDALSAKLVEAAGFDGVYMTGYGQSASKLGQPDVGLMTMSEMVERAQDMVMAVNIPVVCDADTGFGNNVNVVRTMREYERAGAAAIQLEDQTIPKKCGHMLGREVIAAEEMVMKIKAAVAARTDPDFMIIARTDARTNHGIDEAIRRGKLYAQAGADIVFVESVESTDEMRKVNQEIDCYTIANMVETGRTPFLSAQELQEIGYNLVVYPISTLYVATKAVYDMLVKFKQSGTTKEYFDKMVGFEEFNNFIGLSWVRELEANNFEGIVKKFE